MSRFSYYPDDVEKLLTEIDLYHDSSLDPDSLIYERPLPKLVFIGYKNMGKLAFIGRLNNIRMPLLN